MARVKLQHHTGKIISLEKEHAKRVLSLFPNDYKEMKRETKKTDTTKDQS